ncbi:hypothetical protein [Thermocrinis sp.]
MARLVVFTENGPYKLEVGEETYYICMCGLSNKKTFLRRLASGRVEVQI